MARSALGDDDLRLEPVGRANLIDLVDLVDFRHSRNSTSSSRHWQTSLSAYPAIARIHSMCPIPARLRSVGQDANYNLTQCRVQAI